MDTNARVLHSWGYKDYQTHTHTHKHTHTHSYTRTYTRVNTHSRKHTYTYTYLLSEQLPAQCVFTHNMREQVFLGYHDLIAVLDLCVCMYVCVCACGFVCE
jgi:hypothetical protein